MSTREDILSQAAQALRQIVEGIDGTMNHGTWRDDHGRRLKDTPEWVTLYNAICTAQHVAASKFQPAGKNGTLLQALADQINASKPSPATSDDYAAAYADGKYDAWLIVQEAADTVFAAAPEPPATRSEEQPPYPEGEVVGPCVCGGWPGGRCLRCPWRPATRPEAEIRNEGIEMAAKDTELAASEFDASSDIRRALLFRAKRIRALKEPGDEH